MKNEKINCQNCLPLVNLKKAKSLLTKIEEMIEAEEYCVDIMQQTLAVIGLLKSANSKLLANHLNTCFRSAMESKNDKKKQAMIEEILQVSRLSQK